MSGEEAVKRLAEAVRLLAYNAKGGTPDRGPHEAHPALLAEELAESVLAMVVEGASQETPPVDGSHVDSQSEPEPPSWSPDDADGPAS